MNRMENLGSDFNTTGSVMSAQELTTMRKKRGECVTCGRKCFKKKVFKFLPLTEPGLVTNGKCLRCFPPEGSSGVMNVPRPTSVGSLSGSGRQPGPLTNSSATGTYAPPSGGSSLSGSLSGSGRLPGPLASAPRSASLKPSPTPIIKAASRTNSLPMPSLGNKSPPLGSKSNSNRSMNSARSTGSGSGGGLTHVVEEEAFMATAVLAPEKAPSSFTTSAVLAPEPPASSFNDSYGPDFGGEEPFDDYSGYAETAAAAFGGDGGGGRNPADLPPIPPSRESETAVIIEGNHPSGGKQSKADLEKFVDRLSDSSDTPEGVERSMEEIATLELSMEDLDTLAGMDAPRIIAEAMCRHKDSMPIQKWGCSAIYNLSATENCQQGFVKGGALDAIVTTMETNINDSSFQEQAITALSNLSASKKNLSLIVSKDAVTQIIEAMNAHTGRSSVQIKACTAITNLASHDSHHKRKIMEIAGGVVVIAMVMNPNHVKLLEAALRALRNLSHGNDENKMEIANNGGVDSIIAAMQVNRDEAGIQLEGAWTLSNLSTTTENMEVIGDCGGIDVLIRTLWVHSEESRILEKSLRALFHLSLDEHNAGIMLEVGGINAIITVMQGHSDSPAVQEMCCAVLYNLGDVSDDNRMQIVDEEALDAIVLCMMLHSEDAEVQKRACLVLQCLCIPDNFKPMFAANIVELVTVAGEKFPGCREPHDFIIARMDDGQ
jgi:hypothetical protein